MRRDRGSAEALGLVLIWPAMLGVAVLIAFLGRLVDTRAQLQAAGDAAAQSAALQRSPAAAARAARSTAVAMLTDADACPGGPRVVVDTSGWAPGGVVTVTVACTPRSEDLAPVAPAGRTVTASGSATIDPHRAAELP